MQTHLLMSTSRIFEMTQMMSVLKRFLVSLVPQLSVRLLTDKNGKSKDFAYVGFENCEDAQKTIEGMNGKVLNGSHVYVDRAQSKAQRKSELKHKFEQIKQGKLTRCKGANIYVKNLEDAIDNK